MGSVHVPSLDVTCSHPPWKHLGIPWVGKSVCHCDIPVSEPMLGVSTAGAGKLFMPAYMQHTSHFGFLYPTVTFKLAVWGHRSTGTPFIHSSIHSLNKCIVLVLKARL